MVNYEYTAEMTAWLDGGKSPWHTVEQAKSVLCAEGFEELGLTEPFHAAVGGKYFVESGTFLAAVTVGDGDFIRVAAAHTDWPCLRIKPRPELVNGSKLCRLSVEPYGGAILNTWLDRPLGLAGAVMLRGDSPMRPVRRLVSWDEGVLVIPNVAIHMNREVNKGVAVRPNVDMLPICRAAEAGWEMDGYLLGLLAKKLLV